MRRILTRRTIRRIAGALFIVLASALLPTEAYAQCAQSAAPLNDARIVRSVAGEPLVVRLHANACASFTAPTTELSGSVLKLSLVAELALPCGVERDIDFALPALPVGSYVLLYVPEAPISLVCYATESVPFGVTPPVTAVVPALGAPSLVLLALLATLLACRALRRRTSYARDAGRCGNR